MAEAIGSAIIAALATAGVTVTATASTVGSIAILTATTLTSVAVNLLNQPKQRNETQQSVLNQAIGPRVGVYGRTIVGGSRFLFESRNGALVQGIVTAAHQIDAYEKYLIGDRYAQVAQTTVDGLTVKDYPQTDKIGYEIHLGTDDQLASSFLMQEFGTGLNPIWSSAHRLRGLAYVVVLFFPVKKEEQSVVYPQGYATPLRFQVRGKRVWDPTNATMNPDDPATWAWSENSIDCVLDYLRSRDGLRFNRNLLDIPSFQDFHATCAELVARKDGSTEPRYRLGGTYSFNEPPKDVLARMLATCDGRMVRGPTGLIGVRGGKYVVPGVSIGTDQITGVSLMHGTERLEGYNRLSVSYSEPDAYFQPTQLAARDNVSSQAQIGVVDATFDLVMVPSWTQAARLAKIKDYKDNPEWRGSISTNIGAINALGEDNVNVLYDPLMDPSVKPFMQTVACIENFSMRGDMSGCDLDFLGINPEAYAWNPATEEPAKPAVPGYVAPVNNVPAPVNLSVSPSRRTVSGGSVAMWAILSWNAATRADSVPEAQYRASTGTDADYQPMALRSNGTSAEVGPLTDGVTYLFRVRFVAGSTPSTWTGPVSLAVTTDNVAPAAPTYTSATASGSTVTHVVRQSPSANARSVELRRAIGFDKVFADAVASASQVMSPNQGDPPLSETYDLGYYQWWAVALNGSGLASAPAGPKSLLRMTQPGNILVAPSDLTNAAWTKTRTTAALSGTAPDGSSATMIAETAVNSTHLVQQTIAITNGSRYRASMAIKAAGRTKGALHLYDSAVTSRATNTFDIAAGTFSLSSAGTQVTSPVATLSKISADWWLLTVTGTVASDNAVVRLSLYDDTNNAAYLGDTTKGFLVGGANLALVN